MDAFLAIHIDSGERQVLSVHKTQEGAEKALQTHKAFEEEEYNRMEKEFGKLSFKFGAHKYWIVHKYELKD